jgi:hypothetical protein
LYAEPSFSVIDLADPPCRIYQTLLCEISMKLATALILFVASVAIAAPADIKRDALPQSGHPSPPAAHVDIKREASEDIVRPICRPNEPR